MNTELQKVGNEEIAKMLGSRYISDPFIDKEKNETVDFWHWTKPKCGYPIDQIGTELSTCWMIGNFKFHSSFDWLFLCVEQIEKITGLSVLIQGRAINITWHGKYQSVTTKANRKYSLFVACFDFAMYYNSQKDKRTNKL